MIGVQGKILNDISLSGLVMNTIDDLGCSWIVTGIDGWWDLPPVDLPDDVRPYQYDGSYTTNGRYKSREIVLSGYIEPPAASQITIATARRRLLQACELVRESGAFIVNEVDASKTAQVRLSDQPDIAITHMTNSLIFQIPLRAVDPRKYSTAVTTVSTPLPTSGSGRTYNRTHNMTYGALGSAGTINALNAGDYSTGAQISFLGPVSNPSVEHVESGARMSFNIVLSNTDTLTIDLMAHTVRLNGVASRRSSMAFNSNWFLLQPGANTLRFTGTQSVVDPRTAMSVTYQSAWIE